MGFRQNKNRAKILLGVMALGLSTSMVVNAETKVASVYERNVSLEKNEGRDRDFVQYSDTIKYVAFFVIVALIIFELVDVDGLGFMDKGAKILDAHKMYYYMVKQEGGEYKVKERYNKLVDKFKLGSEYKWKELDKYLRSDNDFSNVNIEMYGCFSSLFNNVKTGEERDQLRNFVLYYEALILHEYYNKSFDERYNKCSKLPFYRLYNFDVSRRGALSDTEKFRKKTIALPPSSKQKTFKFSYFDDLRNNIKNMKGQNVYDSDLYERLHKDRIRIMCEREEKRFKKIDLLSEEFIDTGMACEYMRKNEAEAKDLYNKLVDIFKLSDKYKWEKFSGALHSDEDFSKANLGMYKYFSHLSNDVKTEEGWGQLCNFIACYEALILHKYYNKSLKELEGKYNGQNFEDFMCRRRFASGYTEKFRNKKFSHDEETFKFTYFDVLRINIYKKAVNNQNADNNLQLRPIFVEDFSN